MKILMVILFIFSMMSGCGTKPDAMTKVTDLRKQLLDASRCSFEAVVTADYGDKLYTFQMECITNELGELQFTVTDPEAISGISGMISSESAALTFDETILAFPVIADGELTPVIAPWIFLNTLKSGYLTACEETKTGLRIYIDDSFEENPLHLQIQTDNNLQPEYAEIVWSGQRILSVDIRNFQIV